MSKLTISVWRHENDLDARLYIFSQYVQFWQESYNSTNNVASLGLRPSLHLLRSHTGFIGGHHSRFIEGHYSRFILPLPGRHLLSFEAETRINWCGVSMTQTRGFLYIVSHTRVTIQTCLTLRRQMIRGEEWHCSNENSEMRTFFFNFLLYSF